MSGLAGCWTSVVTIVRRTLMCFGVLAIFGGPFVVRLGERTLAEHVSAILGTQEVADLKRGIHRKYYGGKADLFGTISDGFGASARDAKRAAADDSAPNCGVVALGSR